MKDIELKSEEITTKRPEGMSFIEYKEKLKHQAKRLKNRSKGVMVWSNGSTYIKSAHGELPKIKIVKSEK